MWVKGKVNCVKMKVAQSCPTFCGPTDYRSHGILPARILKWVAFPFSRGSSQPRDRIQVSHIAVDSLTAELQGKPKNTGMGSLSLFWGSSQPRNQTGVSCICRWILYQLSYEESPIAYQGRVNALGVSSCD